MLDTGSFDHVFQWPPQPSTVNGIGMVVFGCVAAMLGQVEIAIPAVGYGIATILVPDSTTEHAESLDDLHHTMTQVRLAIEDRGAKQEERPKK